MMSGAWESLLTVAGDALLQAENDANAATILYHQRLLVGKRIRAQLHTQHRQRAQVHAHQQRVEQRRLLLRATGRPRTVMWSRTGQVAHEQRLRDGQRERRALKRKGGKSASLAPPRLPTRAPSARLMMARARQAAQQPSAL